jgi:hypothetical protein
MVKTLNRGQFSEMFKGREVVVTELPDGPSKNLACQANETVGRGDSSLRTKAEFSVLFDLLVQDIHVVPPPAELPLRDQTGQLTAMGRAVEDFVKASRGKAEYFEQPMYMVHVSGFRQLRNVMTDPVEASGDARLELWRTDPNDQRHIPPADNEGVLFCTSAFSLTNSGNRTLYAPKHSWKMNFEAAGSDNRLVGMARINLKSMYNDPSQMREALAWQLFDKAGVPSPRHTYAKLAFDATYLGLFSVIEQVDGRFLHDHFGKNHRGNLYKAYCGDKGCATLEYRTGPDGNDSGRQYLTPGRKDHTYRLNTNEDDAESNTYDDLAVFVKTINGVGLPGRDERFDSDAFRESVDRLLNVRAFLRWAGVNLLLGSWDNYFATPSNYYLYNSGYRGDASHFVDRPYFTFIPWDYDNCLGIDYVGTRWHETDLLDWPSNTKRYWKGHATSRIPLVQNLLKNHDYQQYYLDHLEHLLDTAFNVDAVAAEIGKESQGGLWDRVRHAAYLESNTPYDRPFTGRQFTNDEVYRAGCGQEQLRHGNATIDGILAYVGERYDTARKQLRELRQSMPSGASGATFTGTAETLPERT